MSILQDIYQEYKDHLNILLELYSREVISISYLNKNVIVDQQKKRGPFLRERLEYDSKNKKWFYTKINHYRPDNRIFYIKTTECYRSFINRNLKFLYPSTTTVIMNFTGRSISNFSTVNSYPFNTEEIKFSEKMTKMIKAYLEKKFIEVLIDKMKTKDISLKILTYIYSLEDFKVIYKIVKNKKRVNTIDMNSIYNN